MRAPSRSVKSVVFLSSIIGFNIYLATAFSPQSSLRSTPTSCISYTCTRDSPFTSFVNPSRQNFKISSHRFRTPLHAEKNDSDGIEVSGANSLGGEGQKIENWLFALVIPLQLVYVSNQLTRSSIYYLVDFSGGNGDAVAPDPFRAMNVAIGFSEAQYGLLASLAFTALFATASLGAGAAADKYNRKTLTVLSAIGWSVAIIGTSFSTTYNEVLFWRVAMGLFCAFSTPTAYTLISEKVPTDRLSLATSLYGTGVAFGGASASLSILLDNQIGWSQTLLVIGVVGILCALLVGIIVPNDDSKSDVNGRDTVDIASKQALEDENASQSYSFSNDISEALSSTRAKWIYGGSFLRFSSGLCIGVWSAPFFRAAFPDNATDYAVAQAFITAVAGSISGLAGGAAADYISSAFKSDDDINDEEKESNDLTGTRLWVPVVGSLLAAPTWYFAIHSTDSFQVAMIWLTIEYLVAECWFGPTISTLLSTVPSKIGGTAQGLFTLTGAIANLSPTLLGYLYGQASSAVPATDGTDIPAAEVLPALLTTGVCFGYITSAFCFAMGARSAPPLATTNSKSN